MTPWPRALAGVEGPAAGQPISFSRQVAPILVAKCLTCHSPEKVKGGFQLHTFDRLLKGGESKRPSIVPREPAQSELYRRITTEDADDRMPQKDDPLPAPQIATIARWIAEGARFDGPDTKAALLTLVPAEETPNPPEFYPRSVPILALAFSPEGAELAASGYHEVTLWNPADGRLLRRIQGLPERIQSLAYSPDGTRLAIGGGAPGRSGEAVLVDVKKGAIARRLGRTRDTVLAVCFSPNGGQLATGGADNSIRTYAVTTGREQLVIQQHADWVMGLAFDHDGTRLASASRDRTARIYSARTGELETTYTEHAAPVFTVAFSEDGNQVYSAGRDKAIHLWNARDGKKSSEITGFDGEVYKLIVQDGQIFGCSEEKEVREYLAANRKPVRKYSGHSESIYALAYDAPTKRLASGSYDGWVRIWSVTNGATVAAFKAYPAAPPTERRAATGQ